MLALLVAVAFAAPPKSMPKEAAQVVAAEESPTWEKTLEKVVPAVVALRVTGTRDFDTEDAGSSLGTGFVVDAKNGIILTNRHMVHAGPVIAEAVFLDHEEVPLQAIYRDPIHDFGFYRFDPAAVKFMTVAELPLVPSAAHVGMEIRVVGNDAGEKISILDGTLARLDRSAPDYGGDTYNDFNTFYFQAASNTSGGSSGSPVVDIEGRAVALNAGGSVDAASSFYLPLDRVVEALARVEKGEAVPRGTLQTVFEYTAYDEVRRLGLRPETEAAFRKDFPDGTGLLVVTETVPDGPGWADLQSGDVLLTIDGQRVATYAPLEHILDDKVGQPITLQIERGGEAIEVKTRVDDLNAITPASYLDVGRAILHDLSFQQARNHGVPAKGVYVAVPGYWLVIAGIPEGAILADVDGVAVPNLDAFQAELEKKAQGARVRFRWHPIDEPRRDRISVATMDRLWYPMQRCTRDDTTGMWPCTDSPPPPPASPPRPQQAEMATVGSKAAEKLAHSLVMIDFDVPHPTTGIKDFNFQGAGLVVDAAQGLVIVDRDTVPVALGDMTLTFGGSVRIPGHLVYLHPTHDFAVIQYDPALIEGTDVRSADLVDRKIDAGDPIWQVGLTGDYQVTSVETKVERVEPIDLGIAGTPRFRDSNVEGVEVLDSLPSLGGVLSDKSGHVLALWASFVDQGSGDRHFHGLPTMYLDRVIDPLRAGQPVDYRTIGAEFTTISLADARDRGLTDERASALQAHDPQGRKVLEVVRVAAASGATRKLEDGDLLLEVDGEPITRIRELEALSTRDHLSLLILRDGHELTVDLATDPLDGNGVDRVVSWAGLILHAPHLEVATQQGIEPEGVYIAWMWYGSPAAQYGLRPTRRIVEIDGIPTPDLDAFVKAVKGGKRGQPVRVKMMTLEGKVQVTTLKLDPDYWPTIELEKKDGQWVRERVDGP